MARKTLKICLWNADGLRNKLGELIHFISIHAVDVMVICETKLNHNHRLQIRNYDTHRRDRNGYGGGVAILIRRTIQHIELDHIPSNVENISIRLLNGLIIRGGYAPPHINLNFDTLDDFFPPNQQILLLADMNARHTAWRNRTNNRNGNLLFTFVVVT